MKKWQIFQRQKRQPERPVAERGKLCRSYDVNARFFHWQNKISKFIPTATNHARACENMCTKKRLERRDDNKAFEKYQSYRTQK